MRLTASTDTQADPRTVWAALVDVGTWPRWTASMTTVERLDDGPLRLGSRARIKQPGFPPLVWEVGDLREDSEFTWTTRSPGVRTVGRHVLTPTPDGGTRITLEVEQTGVLGAIVGALTKAKTRRFLEMEAAGLRAAAETSTDHAR